MALDPSNSTIWNTWVEGVNMPHSALTKTTTASDCQTTSGQIPGDKPEQGAAQMLEAVTPTG